MYESLQAMKEASDKFLSQVSETTRSKCYPHLKKELIVQSLAISDFDQLSIEQLGKQLRRLTPMELRKLRSYEMVNQRRKSILTLLTNELTEKVFYKLNE